MNTDNKQTMANDVNIRLLTASDAARYLAICERTLFELTKMQKLPVVRIGRAVRYDISDLEAFIMKAKTMGC